MAFCTKSMSGPFLLNPFFFFFDLGFMALSLISSRSFIKGGRKPENPGNNHLAIRKQNLAFPHDPSKARTTAVRNLTD